jgi:hypothetical protein
MLTERLCKACRSFAGNHPAGPCVTCGRDLPVDAGVCRPCRKQATLIAGPANKTTVNLSVAAITGHQLRFHFGRLERLAQVRADAPGKEPFSGWTKTFTDPRLCAAIVDRLTFGGNIIETGTDSYRLAAARAAQQG